MASCGVSAGKPYGLRFSQVREASGAPSFRIRDAARTVHRIARERALRDSLDLGPLSVATRSGAPASR